MTEPQKNASENEDGKVFSARFITSLSGTARDVLIMLLLFLGIIGFTYRYAFLQGFGIPVQFTQQPMFDFIDYAFDALALSWLQYALIMLFIISVILFAGYIDQKHANKSAIYRPIVYGLLTTGIILGVTMTGLWSYHVGSKCGDDHRHNSPDQSFDYRCSGGPAMNVFFSKNTTDPHLGNPHAPANVLLLSETADQYHIFDESCTQYVYTVRKTDVAYYQQRPGPDPAPVSGASPSPSQSKRLIPTTPTDKLRTTCASP
ncbi:MAG: hypothetical protein JOY69_03815 [Candidatus Eremiobacteraeota bacterium]|nr:hypothetical protein [Candidatus Eremiobacteraeota bacterium]